MRSLLSASDLSGEDVRALVNRARELRDRGHSSPAGPRRLLGMIFYEVSLRTRVGFSAAAARLGWQVVEVTAQRQSETSRTESWSDTLRTVAGYTDVIVARPGRALTQVDLRTAAPCPLINAGDTGPSAEHPTQAVIDVFALETLVGPIPDLRIGIVGDPRMRVVRSLLTLLAQTPPISVRLVADATHLDECCFPEGLRHRTTMCTWDELNDVDAVYLAGIPHGTLPLERRNNLLAIPARVEQLRPRCVLLSPGPVIDEMDEKVRGCTRDRRFEQSDLGLYVRMAILESIARDGFGKE